MYTAEQSLQHSVDYRKDQLGRVSNKIMDATINGYTSITVSQLFSITREELMLRGYKLSRAGRYGDDNHCTWKISWAEEEKKISVPEEELNWFGKFINKFIKKLYV
jgi:hypothetical protein